MVRSMHKLVIFAALLSQSMKISIQMKFSEQTEMVSSNLRRYYLHSHTMVQNMHAIWWGWVLYIPNQWHWMYKQLHSCYETMENSHEVTISTKFRLLTIISTAFLIVNFFLKCKLFSYATLLFCVISYAYIHLTTNNFIEVAPTISWFKYHFKFISGKVFLYIPFETCWPLAIVAKLVTLSRLILSSS